MPDILGQLDPFFLAAKLLPHLSLATLLACVAVVLLRLASWLRLKGDAEVRNYLQQALWQAAEFARAEVRRDLQSAGVDPARAGDWAHEMQAAELAADYVRQHVPDALRRLGVDDDGLLRLLTARLRTITPEVPPAAAGTPA